MSDQAILPVDSSAQLPPPSGDSEKADKYITQLVNLINEDKLLVSHTDLSKFDPTSLQDHYRLDLKDYEIEVSHNKQPDTGQDLYIILFNNLKYIDQNYNQKVILAYIHLTQDQFRNFKSVSDEQLERKRREAEEKRFRETMQPIDLALEQLSSNTEEKESGVDDINEFDTDRLVTDNISAPMVASA